MKFDQNISSLPHHMSPNIWPQVLERQLVLTCLGKKAELDHSSKLANVHPLGGGNIENGARNDGFIFGPNADFKQYKN